MVQTGGADPPAPPSFGSDPPAPPSPENPKIPYARENTPQNFRRFAAILPPNPPKNRLRRFYRTIYTCFSTLCGAVRRPEKKVHVLSPPSVVFVYFYSDFDLQKYIFSRQKEHNIILLKNSACDGPLKLLFRFAEPAPIGRSPAKRKNAREPAFVRSGFIFWFYQ